jgi:hypothetical protein
MEDRVTLDFFLLIDYSITIMMNVLKFLGQSQATGITIKDFGKLKFYCIFLGRLCLSFMFGPTQSTCQFNGYWKICTLWDEDKCL